MLGVKFGAAEGAGAGPRSPVNIKVIRLPVAVRHTTARQTPHLSRLDLTSEESKRSARKVSVKYASELHHISSEKQEPNLRACQCAKGLGSNTLG